MKSRFQKLFLCLLAVCLLIPMTVPVTANADETEPVQTNTAADLSGADIVTASEGFQSINALFDGKIFEGKATTGNASLTLEHEGGIGSLYFIFDTLYGAYTITNNTTGESRTAGENQFYHEFVDLTALFGTSPTSVTVSFDNGAITIFELSVYAPGEVPDTVQKWNVPYENGADLVLFSTHGDDEQLFFAGVLPYYAAEMGYRVQVVYFTDHREKDPHRVHEMLNGLWAVGVKAYPVFGSHPDFIRRYELEGTYVGYESRGYTREQLLSFVVENIRRFKPLVAVGHDINGEYGHGMHMVYTDLLIKALDITNDAARFPESAEQYGVWDVPKTYLHLYEENAIVMDWDQPLESFDGMTAFEVTKLLGYPCHESQYKDFAWYLAYYDTAAECPKYNPCEYGLYRSTVGEDVEKNDFFENITVYAEQERIAEEERLEAERLAAEEEARRLEEEARLAQEQRQKDEAARQESLAAAEEARHAQEAERQRIEDEVRQRRDTMMRWIYVDIALAAGLIVLLCVRAARNRRR